MHKIGHLLNNIIDMASSGHGELEAFIEPIIFTISLYVGGAAGKGAVGGGVGSHPVRPAKFPIRIWFRQNSFIITFTGSAAVKVGSCLSTVLFL